jgi:CRISPR-associated protein Csd1
MIIESLNTLHLTLVASGALPPSGFQRIRLRYVIELSEQGECVAVTDYSGTPADAAWFVVPLAVRRGEAIKPNLLWDDCEYTLGIPRRSSKHLDDIKSVERRHQAFLDRIWTFALTVEGDAGLDAILRFYNQGGYRAWAGERFGDQERGPAAISFRLQGDRGLIAERTNLREAIRAAACETRSARPAPIRQNSRKRSLVHALLKGLPGGESSAADGVAINLGSGYEGVASARLTDGAGFQPGAAHISAVKWLLRESNRNPLRLGRLTLLAWQEGTTSREAAELLSTVLHGNADQLNEWPPTKLSAPRDVSLLGLLGDGPHTSAVFYRRQTCAGMFRSIACWIEDLELDGADEPAAGLPGIGELIQTVTAVGEENGHHQIKMAIALLQAALFGEKAWDDILMRAIRVLRQSPPVKDWRLATSLIKLSLIRNESIPLPACLDGASRDGAYRLGRLFAVLECLHAIADTRAPNSIRDRFWTISLMRPAVGFRVPLRMAPVYLRVLSSKMRSPLETLVAELQGDAAGDRLPPRLSLVEQGLFAIGYFHQMTALSELRQHNVERAREVQQHQSISWTRPALGGAPMLGRSQSYVLGLEN